MEKELFTWSGWDIQDTMCFTYYDVELVRDIGKYPKGTKFDSADLDYEKGLLDFYSEDGDKVASFELVLNAGKELETTNDELSSQE